MFINLEQNFLGEDYVSQKSAEAINIHWGRGGYTQKEEN